MAGIKKVESKFKGRPEAARAVAGKSVSERKEQKKSADLDKAKQIGESLQGVKSADELANRLANTVGATEVQKSVPVAQQTPLEAPITQQDTVQGVSTLGRLGETILSSTQPFGEPVAQLGRLIDDPAEELGNVALGVGILGTALAGVYLASVIVAAGGNTAATQGMYTTFNEVTGTFVLEGASNIATNPATFAATKNLLVAAGLTIGSAGLLATAIGTYPFAGFIQEEAIQTLGFATKGAIENGDWDSALKATKQVDEILNPVSWNKFLEKVPYANVLSKLKMFYKAAALKNSIDKKIIVDLKEQEATGKTDSEMYVENQKQVELEERATTDYYNDERKLMIAYERAAEVTARNEDAEFWRKEREKTRAAEAADRQAIANFWLAYAKEKQKFKDDSRPSNLNFGLL